MMKDQEQQTQVLETKINVQNFLRAIITVGGDITLSDESMANIEKSEYKNEFYNMVELSKSVNVAEIIKKDHKHTAAIMVAFLIAFSVATDGIVSVMDVEQGLKELRPDEKQ